MKYDDVKGLGVIRDQLEVLMWARDNLLLSKYEEDMILRAMVLQIRFKEYKYEEECRRKIEADEIPF